MRDLEKSDGSIETSCTLPPLCYTDETFYRFEQEALFNHEWLCVGRESQIKEPGDYFTTSIVGEPIIVARNRAGELHAFSAVCQHRAMLVAEGAGNTRGFTCPYHLWVYSLDGALVNAPAMERTCGFDKKKVRLAPFQLEIWNGFIFINFDPSAAPLAPRLRAVERAIAGYRLEEAELAATFTGKFPWNWKVMFENNNDGYHANKLHRGPLHDFVPSERATFPNADPADAGFLRFNGTLHPDASFNPTQRAVLPVFPRLTDEDRGRMTFANIPPTLSLVLTSDLVIYLILRAGGAEVMEQDTGILVAPGAMADPAFEHRLEMIMTSARKIIAQDMHVDELVQVGLRSRFAARGRYSWQEGAQGQLNRWLLRRYRQTWERMKGKTEVAATPALVPA
ncbi:MAG TPA: SRPBCC family protein [Caulobacteraceae bacterium]|nr:SRPBCC family protein [Caulobacteraceae bacterium]